MNVRNIIIDRKPVQYCFEARFSELSKLCHKATTILVTDEHVHAAHATKFKGWKHIVLPAGEVHKQQSTVDYLLQQLIGLEADRSYTLVGVGGGVITDMVGYASAVYMRGIRVGFVPTTLLAMVDASIGGKNGVDAGIYKNLVGTIRQPDFLLFDSGMLATLPLSEWQCGFAEIIKHAAIKDAAMYRQLESAELTHFMKNREALDALVMRNALLKTSVVKKDPYEKGDRRLLNFGHTIGHAIETENNLMHGEAVAIGMVYAAHLSAKVKGFADTMRLVNTIEQYGLPSHAAFDMSKALQNMRLDKKRQQDFIRFILLERIGKAVVENIPIAKLEKWLG